MQFWIIGFLAVAAGAIASTSEKQESIDAAETNVFPKANRMSSERNWQATMLANVNDRDRETVDKTYNWQDGMVMKRAADRENVNESYDSEDGLKARGLETDHETATKDFNWQDVMLIKRTGDRKITQ